MLSHALRNEIWQHLITSLEWISVLKYNVQFVVAANSTRLSKSELLMNLNGH